MVYLARCQSLLVYCSTGWGGAPKTESRTHPKDYTDSGMPFSVTHCKPNSSPTVYPTTVLKAHIWNLIQHNLYIIYITFILHNLINGVNILFTLLSPQTVAFHSISFVCWVIIIHTTKLI